jgi:hypothetical protein
MDSPMQTGARVARLHLYDVYDLYDVYVLLRRRSPSRRLMKRRPRGQKIVRLELRFV